MLLFKRISIARFGPVNSEKAESLRPENDNYDLLMPYLGRMKSDHVAIKFETSRGWCSWGF